MHQDIYAINNLRQPYLRYADDSGFKDIFENQRYAIYAILIHSAITYTWLARF